MASNDGKRRVNPKTGKEQILRNGHWVNLTQDEVSDFQSQVEDRFNTARQRDRNKVQGEERRFKPVGTTSPRSLINYDSPMEFIRAWANRSPKTKAGKWLYKMLNTALWMNNYYQNRKITDKNKPQNDAVDEGYRTAITTIAGYCPSDSFGDVDKFTGKDAQRLYNGIRAKAEGMHSDYVKARGKSDPDSLRIKAEYMTYKHVLRQIEKEIDAQSDKEPAKDNPAVTRPERGSGGKRPRTRQDGFDASSLRDRARGLTPKAPPEVPKPPMRLYY